MTLRPMAMHYAAQCNKLAGCIQLVGRISQLSQHTTMTPVDGLRHEVIN
jgi:hypothetical protein